MNTFPRGDYLNAGGDKILIGGIPLGGRIGATASMPGISRLGAAGGAVHPGGSRRSGREMSAP